MGIMFVICICVGLLYVQQASGQNIVNQTFGDTCPSEYLIQFSSFYFAVGKVCFTFSSTA